MKFLYIIEEADWREEEKEKERRFKRRETGKGDHQRMG